MSLGIIKHNFAAFLAYDVYEAISFYRREDNLSAGANPGNRRDKQDSTVNHRISYLL